jgi:hypothetical protein
MESYALDFRLQGGSATGKYEALAERYAPGAPNLNHLVYREGGAPLWGMKDVAVVLGRSPSSVTRTFQRMRGRAEFLERVEALAVAPDSPGRDAATLYEPEIFDVIVDYFEYAYLERFMRPRHGTPLTEEERGTVRAFWCELKEKDEEDEALVRKTLDLAKPEASAFDTVYECLRMIVKRACSIKMGVFVLALFGIVWELSNRYPWFNVAAPVLSVLGLAGILAAMKRRRGYTPRLADAGACVVVFCLLWTLALFVPESPMSRLLPASRPEAPMIQPQGNGPRGDEPLDPKVHVALTSAQASGGKIWLVLTPGRPAREIFYKFSSEEEYRSTGSLPQIDPRTSQPFPNLGIQTQMAPVLRLYVQYVGIDGETYGPYTTELDVEKERFALAKNSILNSSMDWVSFSRLRGVTTAGTSLFAMPDNSALEKIAYGINTEIPDKERRPGERTGRDVIKDWQIPDNIEGPENVSKYAKAIARSVEKLQRDLAAFPFDNAILARDEEGTLRFISIQVFFRDGTKSEVRIYENTFNKQTR